MCCKGSKLASLLQLSWAQAFSRGGKCSSPHPRNPASFTTGRERERVLAYYTKRRGRGQVWRDCYACDLDLILSVNAAL